MSPKNRRYIKKIKNTYGKMASHPPGVVPPGGRPQQAKISAIPLFLSSRRACLVDFNKQLMHTQEKSAAKRGHYDGPTSLL